MCVYYVVLCVCKTLRTKRETDDRDSTMENNLSGGADWHILINSPISLSALTDAPVAKAGSSPTSEEEADKKGGLVKVRLLLLLEETRALLLLLPLSFSLLRRLSLVSNIIEGPNNVLTFMFGLGLGGWGWAG
jgi:hypothetical protein